MLALLSLQPSGATLTGIATSWKKKSSREQATLPLKKRRPVLASVTNGGASKKSQKVQHLAKQSSATSTVQSNTFTKSPIPSTNTNCVPSNVHTRTFGSDQSDETVKTPSPPLLVRNPTGVSTAFNTYSRCSTGPLLESLTDFTWGSNTKTPPPNVLEQLQEMSECMNVASPVGPDLRRDFLASFDDARSDKAYSSNTHLGTVLPGATSQDIHRGADPNDHFDNNDSSSVTLPSSLLTGKLIQTPQGLALLLASRPKTEGYSAMYASSASNTFSESNYSVDTRNKRWTRAEDAQLKYAVSREDSPPINWKEIARLFFSGTRNYSQVCLSFRPVDRSIVYFGG